MMDSHCGGWDILQNRTKICEKLKQISGIRIHGQSRSFSYPPQHDILLMSSQDILTVVNVTTATGRAYALCDEDIALKELSKQVVP